MSVTIATFNVNSIRARLPNVLAWLKAASPDIALLQELKCEEAQLPAMELEELGYNLAVFGQKTYNGVAILSKFPISDVTKGLPTLEDDAARYIEAVIEVKSSGPGSPLSPEPARGGAPSASKEASRGASIIRVASIYVPNGGEIGSDKFQYKLRFLEALKEHAEKLLTYGEPLILGGDYNVAPADLDVYAPKSLRGTTCFHPEEQQRLRAIEYLGLTDAFRAAHPDKQEFSWWDYRGGGWDQNKGMRIDHLLVSAQAADLVEDCGIDAAPRGLDKASDHTPVWCKLAAG